MSLPTVSTQPRRATGVARAPRQRAGVHSRFALALVLVAMPAPFEPADPTIVRRTVTISA
ncbi:MAG: hypothetical protein U0531_03715 [Dehalococcoidia bacterium]